jgi:hypothetical protein
MPKRIRTHLLFPLALLGACAEAADSSSFNPDISLILDGRYRAYSNDSEYALPGFMLGEEAGRGEEGFHLGHNELAISANVDDLFYGKLTAVIADHEGSTETELEEAYIETQGLGHGLTIRAGRFFSGIGYLNVQHPHAWDFADAPLVYDALFGGTLRDDGLQVGWVAPTDLYLKLGGEITRGERFPAGGATSDGAGARALFVKIGGDLDVSNAWQLGFSHWQADVEDRTAGGHAHDGTAVEVPTYSGKSKVYGVDFVWKWAPLGNTTERNFKLQAEYFMRDETGSVIMDDGSDDPERTSYDGTQTGWYLQGVYQFMPRWRLGLRYDRLEADNEGSDALVLTEVGLDDLGHSPTRTSLMLDYSHSEYSRLRLQYAKDDSYPDSDDILTLQYIMSLGPHGAHTF